MKNKAYFIMPLLAMIAAVFVMHFVSAVVVSSVDAGTFFPGEQGSIRVEIKNTLSDDVEDLSFSLKLSGVPFISIGGSEASVRTLGSGERKSFSFDIRPAYDIKPGDYAIPYEIIYSINGESQTPKQGTIGVSVGGNPKLIFSATVDTPVVGSQGKINLKIVNNGLASARFVSVQANPAGYTLLSGDSVYIGTISSDDFETASFDVIFNSDKANLNAIISYKDLDNKDITKQIEIPLTIYTKEKALELGIIKKSYTVYYIVAVIVVIVIWLFWRSLKKRQRMRKSLKES